MSRSKSKQPISKVRSDLIRSYALAQNYMGIEKTLEIKRAICGYDILDEVPLPQLREIIKKCRELFKIDFKNKYREKKIKEGYKVKTKVLSNDPQGEDKLKKETTN